MITVQMCPGRLPLNGALSSAFSPVRWSPCRSGVLTLILSKSTCPVELYYMNGSGAGGGFAGGEVQSGRWAGGLFGPLASTTGGGRGCGSNAAVAAAATAAAAEAAAASKAAAAHEAATKAAAAANERRALDVRTPSKEPDLLEESGGSARLMDGEGFSGVAVFGVGARVRVLAATAPGLLPRLATGCGEGIVTAFGPR